MGSVSLYQGDSGYSVSGTASWTTGPEVNIDITYNSGEWSWRIRGRNPDTTVYLEGTGSTRSASFNAVNGKEYAFQVYVGGSFSNGQIFKVDFSDDSGDDDGDDGGGGGSSSSYYTVYLYPGDYSWDNFPSNTTLTKYHGVPLPLPQLYKSQTTANTGSFTITGNANGGDNNTSLTGLINTITNYTFNGWHVGSYSRIVTTELTIDASVGLSAQQSSSQSTSYSNNTLSLLNKPTRSNGTETFTINFNGNGGKPSKTSDTATRTVGYRFAYWCSNSDGSGTQYPDSSTFNSDTTVYAIWNITSDNTTEIALPTATRDGYTFVGWGESSSSEYFITDTYVPTKSTTLYAQWSSRDDIKYTVKHHTQDLGSSAYSIHSTYTKDANTDEKLIIYNLQNSIEGFTFKEGKVNGAVATEVTVLTDGSLVIDLYYTRNTYSLSLVETTTVYEVVGAGTYEYGAPVTIEASFDRIYHLEKWSGSSLNLTDNPATFNMPASSISLTPTIGLNTYRIEFDGNGDDGTGYTPSMSMVYDTSKQLNLNGFSNPGHAFKGWNTAQDGSGKSYNDGESVKNLTYVHKSIVTLYAQWSSDKYTITYNADSATNVPSTEEKSYGIDYTISNMIPEKPGYTFAGWSISNSDNIIDYNPGDVYSKNESLTLYAVWSSKTFTNTINHLMTGFKSGEGNTDDGKYYLLKTETFTNNFNNTFSINNSNAISNIPNGFKLNVSFGYVDTNETKYYALGNTIHQVESNMTFNLYYDPIEYPIMYNLNGGNNNINNPATYNVLYGVTFKNANKPGSKFSGWTDIANSKITGINENVTSTFDTVETLYNELSSRDIGNVVVNANWQALGAITIPGVGNYQCFIYSEDDATWYLYAPHIVTDGAWEPY